MFQNKLKPPNWKWHTKMAMANLNTFVAFVNKKEQCFVDEFLCYFSCRVVGNSNSEKF